MLEYYTDLLALYSTSLNEFVTVFTCHMKFTMSQIFVFLSVARKIDRAGVDPRKNWLQRTILRHLQYWPTCLPPQHEQATPWQQELRQGNNSSHRIKE